MLSKKGLIVVLLAIAVALSLFSINAAFFPESGIFAPRGESYVPENNVQLTILPPENATSVQDGGQ